MLVALVWVVCHAPAAPPPPPRVLLLSSPTVVVGEPLRDSTRVQLAGIADLGDGPPLAGSALSDRVAEAASRVAGQPATLIVWLERTETDGEYVLFAVSRNRERALIQVVHLPAASEAELDRVIAVKIALLVEAALPVATVALEPDNGRPRPPAAPPAPAAATRQSKPVLIEAGLAAGIGANRQVGLRLGIGARAERGRFAGETYLAVWQAGGLDFTAPAGDVIIDEIDVGFGARLLAGRRRVAGGLWLEAGARLLDARGVARDGATGSAVRAVPLLAGGLELRWMPGPRIAVRAGIGVGLTPRYRFLIDDQEVADTGRWRAIGILSTVISLP